MTINGDPLVLEPYRVDWRANLVTGWHLLDHYSTHDEALEGMEGALLKHGGQARIVVQHVAEASGLGA